MTQSDLFFYIGHNLEGFVNKSKSILEKDEGKLSQWVKSIQLSDHNDEATTEEHNHDHDGDATTEEHDHDHGGVDPHSN